MQEKLNVLQFCQLHGCNDYTASAISIWSKHDAERLQEKTYDEWHEFLKDSFTLGEKIDFTTAPKAVETPEQLNETEVAEEVQ